MMAPSLLAAATVGAVLLASSVSGAAIHTVRGTNHSAVRWGPCNATELPNPLPIECGILNVPLDYSSPSSGVLPLELVRLPATKQPSKGIIQFNFGGPGIPGQGAFVSLLPIIVANTGPEYDLVVFDPRGTGKTIPFTCDLTLSIGSQLANSTDVAVGAAWAQAGAFANRCAMVANETGSLISTAFTARDLMSVAETLDDGMLRYWGLSYGTTLGITTAAMFPDRIARLMLDGVSNPHEYYNGLAEVEAWTNSDKVFSAIFETCVERPDNCTLSRKRPNATAAELEGMVWNLLWELKERPFALKDVIVGYEAVKATIVFHIYNSEHWDLLADQLDMLLARDRDDELYEVIAALIASNLESPSGVADALSGIKCSDRRRRSDFEGFLPMVDQLFAKSRFYGEFAVKGQMDCAQWRIEAKERYLGGFDVKTANPVLIVGNTVDGHTPLESARNVSSTFEGSVILEIEGFGHGSSAVPSKCAVKAIRAYWSNGTLPEAGTRCTNDAAPFSGRGWNEVLLELAAENVAS